MIRAGVNSTPRMLALCDFSDTSEQELNNVLGNCVALYQSLSPCKIMLLSPPAATVRVCAISGKRCETQPAC